MAQARMQKAPWFGGWIIGAAMGVVAFAGLVVVGGFNLFPAAYLGGVLAVVAGLGMELMAGGDPLPSGAAVPSTAVGAVSAPAAAAAPVALKAAPVAATPVAAAPAAKASAGPVRYDAPRGGKADNLQEIEGIGPTMEKLVNSLGFWHFDQLAGWSEADVAWVDQNLKGFKGRVTRDKWVNQARIIVSEGLEKFRVRAKTNDY